MCKLYIAAGKFNRHQVHRMIIGAARAFDTSQRDGFGFAAYGNGQWCYGKYSSATSYSGFEAVTPPFVANSCIEHGAMPETTTAIIIHGRTSTNKVRIENSHPFVRKNLMLVHNGILNWGGETKRAPVSRFGCDSEEFLNWLIRERKKDGTIEASMLTKSKRDWSGYGVFGVINSDTGRLTVAKCGTGRLSWVGGNGFDAYSTDGCDAVSITNGAGLDAGHAFIVGAGTIAVYEEKDGERVLSSHHKWDGFGSRVQDANFHKSYGGPGMGGGAATTYYDYRDDSRYSRHQASVGCSHTPAAASSSKAEKAELWKNRYVRTESGWMRKVGTPPGSPAPLENPPAAATTTALNVVPKVEPPLHQGDRSAAMVEALRNEAGIGDEEEKMTAEELEAMHDAHVAELEQRALAYSYGGGGYGGCGAD